MYLKESKKKQRTNVRSQPPFPITFDENDWIICTAYLGISGTCIVDPQEMAAIHSMGFFGKGTLSRSFPIFGKRYFGATLVRDRQWKCREHWLEEVTKLHSEAFPLIVDVHDTVFNMKSNECHEKKINDIIEDKTNRNSIKDGRVFVGCSKGQEKFSGTNEIVLNSTEVEETCGIFDETKIYIDETRSLNNVSINLPLQPDEYLDDIHTPHTHKDESDLQKILVLPDSDSDTEKYLRNITPKIETERFPLSETLQLTFEETFFLMYGLGCLQLVDYDGKAFSIIHAWNHFNEQDKYFLPKYVSYHYFRSKGWVVRPGLKFGSDFLLYKQGPPFYHASYIVTVECVQGHTLVKDECRSTRELTWNKVLHINRQSGITGKEFLIAQVLWPPTIPLQSNTIPLEILSEFTVRELLWRRWKPTQNDNLFSLNTDEDSKDEDTS